MRLSFGLFFLAGASAIGSAVAQKRQQPRGMYIGVFIPGVLLTSIVALIGAGQQTVFQHQSDITQKLNFSE